MQITFREKKDGLSATIVGFSVETLSKKVDACKSGECSCECDPSVMAKIKDVTVLDSKEGAQINITGDVDIQTLAPMMQKCLIADGTH